ncbi:MAG: hypothetical protein DRI81_18520 [Chloroflexi bacterium]|nr:MAG: hypothetical protein DRI81_18520 [Chloroflexota bacterium]
MGAILGFDSARNLAFSVYAWPSITCHVWRAAKEYARFYAPLTADDGTGPGETPGPALVWEAMVTRQVLDDLVRCLDRRLREEIAVDIDLTPVCAWSISTLCVSCWPNFWAGLPPEVTTFWPHLHLFVRRLAKHQ